jgi:hypothetical protein
MIIPVATALRDLMAVGDVNFPGLRLLGNISILRDLATCMSSIMTIEVKKQLNVEGSGFELYLRGKNHFEVW